MVTYTQPKSKVEINEYAMQYHGTTMTKGRMGGEKGHT